MPIQRHVPQTTVGLPLTKRPQSFLSEAKNKDINSFFCKAEATSPLDKFSIVERTGSSEFVAGWEAVKLSLSPDSPDSSDSNWSEPYVSHRHPQFFSVANPGTNIPTKKALIKAYYNSTHDNLGIRSEIGRTFLGQAQKASTHLQRELTEEKITNNQKLYMDSETGTGQPYLHDRDKKQAYLLADNNKKIHTFLPGYATGDRYSLILSLLLEERLHVSIVYSEGDTKEALKEKQCAEEAKQVIIDALKANNIENAEQRISLLTYDGPNLKDARETLNEENTRKHFHYVSGGNSPLITTGPHESDYVFHISVTTELLARHFRDSNGNPKSSVERSNTHQRIRESLHALVSEETRNRIDSLVSDVMQQQGIPEGAIGLWIADRQDPNKREARAISRPAMFELIADRLIKEDYKVYGIADTYINPSKDGEITNRHPYRPGAFPHIGRFWAAEIEDEQILAPRENQWYFMDALLTKTGSPLIGIRSGALEPFALMGHKIIYLEDVAMFTPERHASWQGLGLYDRLMIEKPVGYINQETEITKSDLTRQLISQVLEHTTSQSAEPYQSLSDKKVAFSKKQSSLQSSITNIEESIQNGVMSTRELDLLIEMLKPREKDDSTKQTAMHIAKELWH